MNRALADAVVTFIGDSSDEHETRLRTFSNRQWRQNHHWLITSGLALHLLDTLRKSNAQSALPGMYHRRLAALYDASGLRTDELRRDLLGLNRRFQALEVPYVNWKGFALEPDFCPDIRLRNQADYDFIIRPEDRELFHAALRDAGYTRTEQLEHGWCYELFPGEEYSLEDVYRPKPHRRVELHLGKDAPATKGRPADFTLLLKRREVRAMEGTAFPVPAAEDAFLAHAAHAGKHALNGWVRVAWLLELQIFARRYADDVVFWRNVENRLDAASAVNVALALALASYVWPTPLSGPLSCATDFLPRNLIRWLDQNGRSFALSEFPGTKLHLFLHRELLDATTFHDLERSSLYPIKVPAKVAYAPAKAPLAQRVRAVRNQVRFILLRTKFHLLENVRYLLMKRRWQRSAVL